MNFSFCDTFNTSDLNKNENRNSIKICKKMFVQFNFKALIDFPKVIFRRIITILENCQQINPSTITWILRCMGFLISLISLKESLQAISWSIQYQPDMW